MISKRTTSPLNLSVSLGWNFLCLLYAKQKNADATVYAQLETVKLVKPAFVVVQMKIVTFYTHSNDLHKTTAKDFFDIGYYTNITERLSSSICGDVTDIGRWILFGHIFPGPSFDMLAYSDNSAFGQLLSFSRYDSSAIPLHVRKIGSFMCTETWRIGQVVQRSDENDDHGSMFVGNPPFEMGSVPPAWGSVHLPHRSLHHKSNTYLPRSCFGQDPVLDNFLLLAARGCI